MRRGLEETPMSMAMLSAVSIFCLDVALAARPLPVAASAAAAQAATEAVEASESLADTAQIVDPAPIQLAQANDQNATPETSEIPVAQETAPDETLLVTASETEAPAEEIESPPVVFEGESDEALVERLKDYLENVDTLTGDFTQIAPSGAISTGKFYLRRPGFLRFEYEPPTPLLIVANGGMVYVRDEALETTDSYPVGRTPLKFLLRKKLELDKAEVLSVDRGLDSFAVTFGPDGDEEAEGELTVILRAPELTLARWIVRDVQNGITVVTLDNVKAGERLANRLFRTPDAGGQFLKN